MIKNKNTHKNTLCIAEWQSFGVEKIEGIGEGKLTREKAKTIFAELVDFAHQEGNHCFLKFKNSNTLVAQNYVGLIQTKSGFCVEILPKTFRADKDFEAQKEDSKNLLIEMLKTLKDSPFKRGHFAHLKAQNMHLLEIFISMLLDELDNLIKKGLKSSYVIQEENRRFLKGKLLFNQNLKYNLSHKERFFTASDEFSANIAPNRIIRSTLEFLSRQALSSKTYAHLTQLRFIFADIPPSRNINKDLSRCANSRLFNAYDLILQWCRVFLKGQAFAPYQGDTKAFAILFDMNKLFENFVASEMKKWFINEDFRSNNAYYKDFMEEFRGDSIKTQEKRKFLALEKENEENRFPISPDIVGYKNKEAVFIADTKWKILSDGSNKSYGISQNDVYQMWAYLSKYKCEKGFLIYPKFTENDNKVEFTFKPNSQLKLRICYFPLRTNKG